MGGGDKQGIYFTNAMTRRISNIFQQVMKDFAASRRLVVDIQNVTDTFQLNLLLNISVEVT